MKSNLNMLLATVATIADPFFSERKPVDPNAPWCIKCHEPMALDASGDMWLCGSMACLVGDMFDARR